MIIPTEQTAALLNLIEQGKKNISNYQQIALACNVEREIIDLSEKIVELITEIDEVIRKIDVSYNYITQFHADINQLIGLIYHNGNSDLSFLEHSDKLQIKKDIELNNGNIKVTTEKIRFNFVFFKKLGFFKNNIVAVGANGCGKTSLATDLKTHLSQNGVVISAQKILVIPTFSGISNLQTTAQKLQVTQTAEKSCRTTYPTESLGNLYNLLAQLGGEFHVILDNLLAERSAARNRFCNDVKLGGNQGNVPETKLDKALEIWNSLLLHRKIDCLDGINITLTPLDGQP